MNSTAGCSRAAAATARTLSRLIERSARVTWSAARRKVFERGGPSTASVSGSSASTAFDGRSSRYMLNATQRRRRPPARSRPVTFSSCVATSAKAIRKTSAMPTPSMMTLRRSFAGRPEVRVPMMTTLSPAMVRSIRITWPSVSSPAALKISAKSSIARANARRRLGVHRGEEIRVRLGVLHLVEKELHRVDGAHLHEDAAQHPHLGERRLVDEQLLLAGAGLADVERREDALVGDLAVEDDLRVAGALELLEDHLVHLRAGIDEGGGDDRERAALLDVPRRAEEALRPLQRVGVDAAGQHLARGGHDRVVGAAQAGDRIEQDDDVLLVLDETLGLFDHHLGDLDVALRRLVKGGGDDLALHRALHVGHFLRPLVD